MAGDITLTIDDASIVRIRDAVMAKAARIGRIPEDRADVIHRIVNDGVTVNYKALSWGGNVVDAHGNNVMWSRNRSAMTVRIRESAGLGALFPILTFTGKLGLGLAHGTSSSAGGRYTWQPDMSVFALIKAHETGGAPLPSRSAGLLSRANKPVITMPPRHIVFWSKSMMDQVKDFIRSAAKNV